MDTLDADCLIRIFYELSFVDKVHAELVCKKWHCVLRRPHAFSHINKVHVRDYLNKSNGSYFQQENLDFVPTVFGVISRCGPYLRELSFNSGWFRISAPIIDVISNYCGQLTELDLSCTLLSADISPVLERVAAQLTYFSIDECNLVEEANAKNISRYFKRMTRLQRLNVRKSRINMEKIIHLPEQLKSIDISGLRRLPLDLLPCFLLGHLELVELALCPYPGAQFPTFNEEDPSNGISTVLDCIGFMPNLRMLSLGQISYDSEMLPLLPIARLSTLETLEIRDCFALTEDAFKEIASNNAQTLTTLILVNCAKLRDYTSLNLCVNLKVLHVEKTFQICDDDIQGIAEHKRLHKLCLRRCFNITNKSAQLALTNCSLQELDVSFCDAIDNGIFEYLCEQKSKLRKILLDNCSRINIDGLKTLMRDGEHLLRYLAELDLSHNKNISNECIRELSAKIDNVRRVKKPLIIYSTQTSVQLDALPALSKRVRVVM